MNGTATNFVLDAAMFVRELEASSGKATYFIGASGPAYRRDDVRSGSTLVLVRRPGIVIGEVDPNGNMTRREVRRVRGCQEQHGNEYEQAQVCGTVGASEKDETGLTYMRARYYDPQIRQFVSENSALHGVNWFAYCSNNPINRVNATGKIGLEELGVGILLILLAHFAEQMGLIQSGKLEAFVRFLMWANEALKFAAYIDALEKEIRVAQRRCIIGRNC